MVIPVFKHTRTPRTPHPCTYPLTSRTHNDKMSQSDGTYCSYGWLLDHPEHRETSAAMLPLADAAWEDYQKNPAVKVLCYLGTKYIDMFDDQFHLKYEHLNMPGRAQDRILIPEVRVMAKWYFTRFMISAAYVMHEEIKREGKTPNDDGKAKWIKEYGVLCWALAVKMEAGIERRLIETPIAELTGLQLEKGDDVLGRIRMRERWILAHLDHRLARPYYTGDVMPLPYRLINPGRLSNFDFDGMSDSDSSSHNSGDEDDESDSSSHHSGDEDDGATWSWSNPVSDSGSPMDEDDSDNTLCLSDDDSMCTESMPMEL